MSTVAILGAGNVGRALGERIVAGGDVLRFGARDPEEARGKLTGSLTGVPALTPAGAVARRAGKCDRGFRF